MEKKRFQRISASLTTKEKYNTALSSGQGEGSVISQFLIGGTARELHLS
jgi:hypothetical protein